jgi:hypothetical protein
MDELVGAVLFDVLFTGGCRTNILYRYKMSNNEAEARCGYGYDQQQFYSKTAPAFQKASSEHKHKFRLHEAESEY